MGAGSIVAQQGPEPLTHRLTIGNVAGDSGRDGCEAAYPTRCIPSPPPDLDCDEVRVGKPFQVLPPDPHGFDGDKDGMGCER